MGGHRGDETIWCQLRQTNPKDEQETNDEKATRGLGHGDESGVTDIQH